MEEEGKTPPPSLDSQAVQHMVLVLAARLIGQDVHGVTVPSERASRLLKVFQDACEAVTIAYGAIDMRAPCGDKDGLNLAQTIVLRHGKLLTCGHVDQWLSRYGQQSLFPDPSSSATLIGKYIDVHVVSRAPFIENASHVMTVNVESVRMATLLLQRAPAHHLPPSSAMSRWLDLLQRARWESVHEEEKQACAGLLQALQALAPAEDPRRGMDRWCAIGTPPYDRTTSLAATANLDKVVLCVSGCQRSLAELARLQAASIKPHGVQDALPRLPHGRRNELALSWVLADVDPPTRRARLWACLKEKPEVLDVLLASQGAAGASRRAQARQLLAMRDEKGRSVGAWLRVAGLYASHAARLADELAPEKVPAADGRGLVEQVLDAYVGASPEKPDCFAKIAWASPERDQSGQPLPQFPVLDLPPESVAAHRGPPDRLDALVSRLVDAIVSPVVFAAHRPGIAEDLAVHLHDLLDDTGHQARLREALVLAQAMRTTHLALAPASTDDPDLNSSGFSRRTMAQQRQAIRLQRCKKHLVRWEQDLEREPLHLRIGVEEWKQLCYGTVDDVLQGKISTPSAAADCVATLRRVCALMEKRAIEADLLAAAATPATGIGRRRPGL